MKTTIRRFIAAALTLCLLLGVGLTACDREDKQDGTETTVTTQASETDWDTESAESESVTDGKSESEESGETETETDIPVEAALPEGEADLVYTSADGFVMSQYNGNSEYTYTAACKYFEEAGYSVYSTSKIGSLRSVVFMNKDGYRTVTLNGEREELYIGTSADGAVLPEAGVYGEELCELTVTQRYSSQINGMTYIIRLTDGSFILIDGGYTNEAALTYETLCELNGSEENIHIRAWLISHSHGDHYQAFSQFSKDYADFVTLDYLLYSPITGAVNQDLYLTNTAKTDVARFEGAQLCGVHTGMAFDFNGLTLEILLGPEQVYKENAPDDFNESSVVCRAVSEDGSMIFLGDCGVNASNWLVEAYGDGLKSDMVQVSHHGCETATAELYDKIAAATLFWPCSESLFVSYRGERVKQHLVEAEYSKEHLLHGYGTVTRPLSYKAEEPEYLDLFPKTASVVNTSAHAENVRFEDGVLKFDVTGDAEKLDPYIYYTLKNVDTTKYNAIRIVVSEDCAAGNVFYTSGTDQSSKFSASKSSLLGVTGTSDDGKTTIIVYLADVEGYTGKLTSIRLDLGSEKGQTVEIYSIEAFYVDVN